MHFEILVLTDDPDAGTRDLEPSDAPDAPDGGGVGPVNDLDRDWVTDPTPGREQRVPLRRRTRTRQRHRHRTRTQPPRRPRQPRTVLTRGSFRPGAATGTDTMPLDEVQASVSRGIAIAAAVTFIWLGMVLAISFLEAPLKFRVPGVTTPIGAGIGRLVFRALNLCEFVFAVVVTAALFSTDHGPAINVAFTVAIGALFFQTVVVRPLLSRRVAEDPDGDVGPRSHAHVAYIGLEVVKVIALLAGGIALVGG